jgi:hypothetical protein
MVGGLEEWDDRRGRRACTDARLVGVKQGREGSHHDKQGKGE